MDNLLIDKILGCAIYVHRHFGPGFTEKVYHAALILKLKKEGLRVETEKRFPVRLDGEVVGFYDLDLLVEGAVILELKAVSELKNLFFSQTRAYMKIAQVNVAFLLNFADVKLIIRRVWPK